MTGPAMPNFGIFTEAAVSFHEQYASYVDAGFTEEQAMDLLKTMITAMFLAGRGDR